MDLTLIARTAALDDEQRHVTTDSTLQLCLATPDRASTTVQQLSHTQWATDAHLNNSTAYVPPNLAFRSHTLPTLAPFGSGQPNEFSTFTMGRELFLSDSNLREMCEDDVRSFAERSDLTEGFQLSTPLSTGFSGLSSALLEQMRDEYPKSKFFSTGLISDARSWMREDSDRSRNQRLLNEALGVHYLEDLSDMVLPIQAPREWDAGSPWAEYLRDDLPKLDTYSAILNAHLQSANSELRGADGLTFIIAQLNWRGDNKIIHLAGAAPLLPPTMFPVGPDGVAKLLSTIKDFSVLVDIPQRKSSAREADPNLENVFAQYSILRGYTDNEINAFEPLLSASTPHAPPLSQWLCLNGGYPVPAAARGIFRGLDRLGRVLKTEKPGFYDALAPAGLYDVPPPLPSVPVATGISTHSLPLLTTLSASPASRHYLTHLTTSLAELLRVRSSVLTEFEGGEYGVGREGIVECRERLESIRTAYDVEGEEDEDGMDEDEAGIEVDEFDLE